MRGVYGRALMDDARRRRVLFGIMLSIFLGAMESTVVATAMPKVVGSLGGLSIYSWVFSGFLLTSTVTRSEEHTSELQSLTNLVCRLLLEKTNDNSATRIQ